MEKTPLRLSRILLLADVETLLGRSAETLRDYVRRGALPRPRRIGKALYWLRCDIERALELAGPAATWPGPDDIDGAKEGEEAEAA